VRLSEIVFPLTLLGFDIHPPGGDNVYAGTVRFATKNPWVILTNNRCTLLAWGRNLNAVSASWRPGVPRVVDILLHDRIDTGERGEINLTYLYGSSIRAESQAAVEAVIRQLERKRR
jgi:hypothetical protein